LPRHRGAEALRLAFGAREGARYHPLAFEARVGVRPVGGERNPHVLAFGVRVGVAYEGNVSVKGKTVTPPSCVWGEGGVGSRRIIVSSWRPLQLTLGAREAVSRREEEWSLKDASER